MDLTRNIRTSEISGGTNYRTIGYRIDTITIGWPGTGNHIYLPGVLGVLFFAFNKVAEAGEEQAC
jgi:hypothetical protein